MAKKKLTGRPKKSTNDTKSYGLTIRSTGEWKRWLEEFANFCRCDMVDAIDRSLANEAERLGFKKPPKR